MWKRSRAEWTPGSPRVLLLAMPFLYAMILPLAILDASISLFQAVCFRMFGIPRVIRGTYLAFGRRRLSYLTPVERFNCEYCGYANGILAYAREVLARTEQYWCPIRHARPPRGLHARHASFLPQGNGAGHRGQVLAMRQALRREGE